MEKNKTASLVTINGLELMELQHLWKLKLKKKESSTITDFERSRASYTAKLAKTELAKTVADGTCERLITFEIEWILKSFIKRLLVIPNNAYLFSRVEYYMGVVGTNVTARIFNQAYKDYLIELITNWTTTAPANLSGIKKELDEAYKNYLIEEISNLAMTAPATFEKLIWSQFINHR